MLGLGLPDTLRFVILPQALRNVLPPTGTTVIYLIKGTALASAIGTPELLRVGQLVAIETFRPVESLTIVAIAYFVLTYPIALAFHALERALAASRGMSQATLLIGRRRASSAMATETVLDRVALTVAAGGR